MQTSDLVCPFCVSARSALKFDRKSRPYFACKGCGARSFLIAIRDAVRSLAVVQPLLAARLEELEADPEASSAARAQEARVAAAFRALSNAPVSAAANPIASGPHDLVVAR